MKTFVHLILALVSGLYAQTSQIITPENVPQIYRNPGETILIMEPLIVDRIEIKGNNITREGIIRRELEFKPGDTLTPEKIEMTKSALMSTKLFSAADIESEEVSSGKSVVTVTVKEKRFPSPYPTIGIDGSTGFYLGAGALYPNLFGQAIAFDMGGEMGFRFSTPRWKAYAYLYMPLTANRWHGEKIAYNYSYLWRKDAEIYLREHRVTYRQDIRPWRFLTLSLEGGWLRSKAYGLEADTHRYTFSTDTVDQSLFLQPIVRIDLRDNNYDTRKGFFFEGRFFINPGLSEGFQMQRACSLSVAGYLPINDYNWLAANVYTYQQLDSIPEYRTIYVGESRKVRGWIDTTQIGPCLSVFSLEYRNRFVDLEFEDLPLLGNFKMWWGANAFFDLGAAHDPGLPALRLADLTGDRKGGLLPGLGFGIAAGTGKLVGKLEFAWGVGSGFNGSKFAFSIPAYFGWRF